MEGTERRRRKKDTPLLCFFFHCAPESQASLGDMVVRGELVRRILFVLELGRKPAGQAIACELQTPGGQVLVLGPLPSFLVWACPLIWKVCFEPCTPMVSCGMCVRQ